MRSQGRCGVWFQIVLVSHFGVDARAYGSLCVLNTPPPPLHLRWSQSATLCEPALATLKRVLCPRLQHLRHHHLLPPPTPERASLRGPRPFTFRCTVFVRDNARLRGVGILFTLCLCVCGWPHRDCQLYRHIHTTTLHVEYHGTIHPIGQSRRVLSENITC